MSFIGFPQLHKYGLVKPFATRRTTRFFSTLTTIASLALLPPLAQLRRAGCVEQCLSLEAEQKTSARTEYFAF
jgi:hypothetical protein